MAGPLLQTKFHIPLGGRALVARARLSDRLSRGTESALTLVSAPAGFGKTTLLAEWLATARVDGRSAAWISLDRRDNDPVLFCTYLITALQAAEPGVGAGALSLLRSSRPPIDAVLGMLLNDLHAVEHEVVLVLDDYHLIDAPEVQDAMAFLLEHLPRQIHLVIAGRADPALPLARLRGRGELVEIRAAELRFTPAEAAAYLQEAMGLPLTATDVAALEWRTEGWIAALQLAALSLRGRDDVAGFIAGFAGDDRYIVDYLAEEVLNRQSEHVRQFLLRTSILDRLSGPLCDAVTGRDGGKAELAALERGNLFLVPLDDRRRWYRYHQLFADVLKAHLLDEQPADVPELHRRASGWYQHNGELPEAIRHALAARDFQQAANLVELAIPVMRRSRQESAIHAWLTSLPDDVIRVRPVLSVGFAGALLARGEPGKVAARLLDAQRWLDADPLAGNDVGPGSPARPEMVVVDEEEFRRLPRAIELYRAALALAGGDVPGTIGHARRAIDLSPEDDHLVRAAASGLLGLAFWSSGDLEAGHAAYAACMAGLRLAGHVADTFGCAIALADIRIVQGRLGDAQHTYRRALQLAGEQQHPELRGTADMHVGMSEIYREHDDLASATAELLRSQELGDHLGLPQNRYRWRVAMSRIRVAEGDLVGAIEQLDEAERVYVGDFFPDVRPVPALRARVWIAQGRLGEALGWAGGRGVTALDDVSYLREFEHVTLARLLLARSADDHVDHGGHRLLERLLAAAQDGARTGSVIEILMLQALSHQAHDDLRSALASLDRALTLAEPEGYLRIFLDEGAPMTALLRAAGKAGVAPGYVRRLLAAASRTAAAPATGAAGQRGLIGPLSERELDVLRLLGTDLDGPDIARRLVVSLNTVRTHTKHIYEKLGVNNRRAAIRRAGELDLLGRGEGP